MRGPVRHLPDPHELRVREEPCGCIRLRCECGHSPDQILAAIGFTLDDVLCDKHKRRAA